MTVKITPFPLLGDICRPPSIDDPWIKMTDRKPAATDGNVWVYYDAKNRIDTHGPRVYLFSSKMAIADSVISQFSHWKPAKILMPVFPGEKEEEEIPDDCLEAWRIANPDYAPDDLPPPDFVAGFNAAKEAVDSSRKNAIRSIISSSYEAGGATGPSKY